MQPCSCCCPAYLLLSCLHALALLTHCCPAHAPLSCSYAAYLPLPCSHTAVLLTCRCHAHTLLSCLPAAAMLTQCCPSHMLLSCCHAHALPPCSHASAFLACCYSAHMLLVPLINGCLAPGLAKLMWMLSYLPAAVLLTCGCHAHIRLPFSHTSVLLTCCDPAHMLRPCSRAFAQPAHYHLVHTLVLTVHCCVSLHRAATRSSGLLSAFTISVR